MTLRNVGLNAHNLAIIAKEQADQLEGCIKALDKQDHDGPNGILLPRSIAINLSQCLRSYGETIDQLAALSIRTHYNAASARLETSVVIIVMTIINIAVVLWF